MLLQERTDTGRSTNRHFAAVAEGSAIVVMSLLERSSLNSGTKLPVQDVVPRPDWPEAAGFGFRPLTYRELRRRFWHMAPGLLPFALHVVPHADPISPTLRWIIVSCCAAIAGRILLGFRTIQRQGEGAGVAAVAGYSLAVLLTALSFPGDLELSVAVLGILAFGDGSATLCGLAFRGPRLPWNRAKSWSGFLAFVAAGSLMSAWIYWGETHNPESLRPGVPFGIAVAVTCPAVVLSALIESIRSRINDNIRVGLTAAVTLILTHSLLVG